MIGFLFRAFGLFVRFVCMAFFVSGVGIMFGFVPFKTCPLLVQMFGCPLPFFVCLVWSPTTFSLFFSLSGAGETQTPFGFGFPLVSLRPGHDLRPRSVHRPLHLPQGSAPAPVFFFFSRRRRRSLVWLWLVAVWLVSLCVGVFCWVGFSLLWFACTCK